jgi:hypothetical protein
VPAGFGRGRTANATRTMKHKCTTELVVALAAHAGAIDLLENDKLLAQIVGLEWRTARGGRDTIDHD